MKMSRRRWNRRRPVSTESCGPASAVSAATCDGVGAQETTGSCSFSAIATAWRGQMSQPSRQPVIA